MAPPITHTGSQDTGSSLIKVKCTDTSHAIGDERQHITGQMIKHTLSQLGS